MVDGRKSLVPGPPVAPSTLVVDHNGQRRNTERIMVG